MPKTNESPNSNDYSKPHSKKSFDSKNASPFSKNTPAIPPNRPPPTSLNQKQKKTERVATEWYFSLDMFLKFCLTSLLEFGFKEYFSMSRPGRYVPDPTAGSGKRSPSIFVDRFE